MNYPLDLINQFIHEELRYKDHVECVDTDDVNPDFIILYTNDGHHLRSYGETIRKSRIDEWIKEKRDGKLRNLGI